MSDVILFQAHNWHGKHESSTITYMNLHCHLFQAQNWNGNHESNAIVLYAILSRAHNWNGNHEVVQSP